MKNHTKNGLGTICATAVTIAAIFIGCQKLDPIKHNLATANGIQNTQSANSKGGTQTCQSIMMDVQGQTEIVITGNEVWHFDELSAAIADFGYNSCSPTNTGNQCRAASLNAAKSAKCSYWAQEGHPHWVLEHVNGEGESGATISLNTTIAGQSFMKGGNFNVNGKYSFTLGSNLQSRIENLRYSVNGGEPVMINHTVVDGNSNTNNCFLNLVYNANNGPYGNSAVYNYLKTGMTIQSILASDDVQNNDAGCPAVSVGIADVIQVNLSAGTHTIVISGTVKGNDGEANVNVSTVKTIHISSESCD